MKVIDPSSGETVRDVPEHPGEEIERRLERAAAAFRSWQVTSTDARAARMRAAAAILRAQAPRFAELMAEEMGKPVREGRAEAEKCAWVCEHYADHAEAMLAPEPIGSDATRSWVGFEPLGAVLAVMP